MKSATRVTHNVSLTFVNRLNPARSLGTLAMILKMDLWGEWTTETRNKKPTINYSLVIDSPQTNTNSTDEGIKQMYSLLYCNPRKHLTRVLAILPTRFDCTREKRGGLTEIRCLVKRVSTTLITVLKPTLQSSFRFRRNVPWCVAMQYLQARYCQTHN